MKCSVVILNWNGEATLRQFLPSVLAYTQLPDVEVVVADNGSSDPSLEFLKTQPVRVIQLEQNFGFAEGYNRAIEQIDAEYTVLLNSDVEVTPDWLSTMLTYMDEHPQTVALQPKVLSWHSKQQYDKGEAQAICFEHAGAAGGMMDILGYPYCRGRLMSHIEEDHGQYDQTMPIFWATGACLLVRTRVYKELGGLDANFFAHQEEIDFCWRIHNNYQSLAHGHQIIALTDSVVYHVGGATLGYENPRKTFLNFRNNLLMLRKNLPSSHRWWIMFLRFFLDYVAALQMLLTGQKANAKAVFQARVEYHHLKHSYQCQVSSKAGKCQAFALLARRSIVLDFYLRKKYK
jgi:GT2 family glycosyltransferase